MIGFAKVVDVIDEKGITKKTKEWFVGPFGLVLENIVALEKPVPVKGNRKFWRLSGKPLKACLAKLTKAQRNQFKEFIYSFTISTDSTLTCESSE
ncbi:MAG: hypothetical protein H7061_04050 [Bdellovibrionaceae bacterium]|nr:hypothetical protein [Bdellovibrio sp.]